MTLLSLFYPPLRSPPGWQLLAKQQMTPEKKRDCNLHAANNYALLTCCSTAVLALPSLLAEVTAQRTPCIRPLPLPLPTWCSVAPQGPAALTTFTAMGDARGKFAKVSGESSVEQEQPGVARSNASPQGPEL